MHYKANNRCTIRYDLAYGADPAPARHWPDLVVAKTYRVDTGQNTYAAMDLVTLLLHGWARVQPIRMAHIMMLLERHWRATGLG